MLLSVCVCFRLKGVSADQEESLLQQLTEITRVMQEGQLVDDVTPEKKSQDDWEGTRALRHCRNYNLQEKKKPSYITTSEICMEWCIQVLLAHSVI